MRYPLNADDFVDLYYGLYEPENVDHRVDYDTISVTADVCGVSVTAVSERVNTRQRDGQTKYNVKITTYVGLLPLDRAEATQIRDRNISPIEPREKYIQFIANEWVRAAERVTDTRRATIVDAERGDEYPLLLSGGSGDFSNVPDRVGNVFSASYTSDVQDAAYAYVDIAGYTTYMYPLVSDEAQVQNVVTDTPPEDLPQTQSGVPALSIDVSYDQITDTPPAHILQHPSQYVTNNEDVEEMCLTALSVAGDSGGQAMLGDFTGDSEYELDFEVLHESLRD